MDAHRAAFRHCEDVLRLIQRSVGISKPQIAQRTGLTPSAVHGIVGRLERAGIIRPAGAADSTGGRCAVRYSFAGDAGLAVGVSLRIDRMELGLFDLALRPIDSRSLDMPMRETGPETCVARIRQEIEALMADHKRGAPPVRGVGISVPGPVDAAQGVVQEVAAAPLWHRYPLARRLQDALGLPVLVEKDVYCAIGLMELTGELKTRRCAAYLSIREGIGAAVMIQGQVFRGSHSLAGEIGHLSVRRDGIPCDCGNTGCLELYCSDVGIVRQYNAQAGGHCARVEDVAVLADAGDEVARRVFLQAVGYLVDATAAIIMNYDPEELLIYCTWLNRQRAYYFHMLDAVYAKSVFTRQHAVDIRLLPPVPVNLSAAASLVPTELLFADEGELLRGLLR
ncbi:MAG: ROK family transcriptional regulator [Oscillospiraceae bacterium]|jgi:predicted NBD/HSP70 family sugar kinase|nr:ROK family transcriptional regulator [Oscillospiraceae bacterium]